MNDVPIRPPVPDTEASLLVSAARLRCMVDSVKDYAILMLDPDGRIASWNAGAELIKGYTAPEIIGEHISIFYSPEDNQRGVPSELLAIAEREGRVENQGWRLRKDGTRFWADVVITAMRESDGTLLGFGKVTRDLTERRRLDERRARQATQQAAIAELAMLAVRCPDVQPVLDRAVEVVSSTLGTDMTHVFELHPDGRGLTRRATSWTASAPLAVVPGSLEHLSLRSTEPVVVDDLARDVRLTSESWASAGVVSGMSVVLPLPGVARPYGVFSALATRPMSFGVDDMHFFQAASNVLASAIGRSLTERQLRLAERDAAKERSRSARAEQAVRERDVFLSVAAHELRTPLTALQLKLESVGQMVRRGVAVPKVQTRLSDALRQTDRLGGLVERLLDVSRIAAGRLELSPEPIDFAMVVRDVVQDFQEQATASRTPIHLTATGNLEGAWDRSRLEQVVSNLLSNAVKYGEGRPVEVLVSDAGAMVHLLVRDHGIGISDEDLPRIFGQFERAAPVQHFGGLGLGLFIAQHIVQAHGGTIELKSVLGRGSEFLVSIPRALSRTGSSVGMEG